MLNASARAPVVIVAAIGERNQIEPRIVGLQIGVRDDGADARYVTVGLVTATALKSPFWVCGASGGTR